MRCTRLCFKVIFIILINLAVFASCTRDDTSENVAQDNRYASPPNRRAPSRYPQQYYQQYSPQQYYRPHTQSYQAPPYNSYGYGAPNSRAYGNPYEFQSPYGTNQSRDNDQEYVLPRDFITTQ